MNFSKTHPLRKTTVRLCWCTAVLTASVAGQEYSPVIEDRVEYVESQPYVEPLPLLEEQPPVADALPEHRGGWDVSAVMSAAYDDNIFLSSGNPESDMVFRLAPAIAYTKGDEKEGEGGFVKVGYRPTGVVYADNSSYNRIDQQAIVSLGWRGKVTRVTYDGAFQDLGDATAETGRPTDRRDYDNVIRAAWTPREKVALEAGVGNRRTNYSNPAYFDYRETYGEAAVRYTYSPKTELGLVYQVGRFKVEGAGPQDSHELKAALAWQPREKIQVELTAGAEYRKFPNGSQVRPVLNGRLGWQPRKGTDIYVTAFMREETSAFYVGENYTVKGVTAGVSQRLGGDWTATIEGGYESNDYKLVSGTGPSGRNDQIWFVRPALIYRLNEKSDLAIFWRVSEDDSNAPGFGYDHQVLGIEFNYRF